MPLLKDVQIFEALASEARAEGFKLHAEGVGQGCNYAVTYTLFDDKNQLVLETIYKEGVAGFLVGVLHERM